MTLYYAHIDVCYHADSLAQAKAAADAIVRALADTPLVHEADVFHVDEVTRPGKAPLLAIEG